MLTNIIWRSRGKGRRKDVIGDKDRQRQQNRKRATKLTLGLSRIEVVNKQPFPYGKYSLYFGKFPDIIAQP